MHSEQPKLCEVLTVLSAVGLWYALHVCYVSDDSSDDSGSPVPVKKHKKHKKKHKRKKVETDDPHNVPSGVPDVGGSPKGSIKLKFKIGRETLATKK